MDLHSGGSSLFYPATLLRGQGRDDAERRVPERLQAAFDLPYAWVFRGGGGPNSTARTLMGAANRRRMVSVMVELGGGGAVTSAILADAERGLRRVLHEVGVLPDHEPEAPRGTRALASAGLVHAYDAGVFESVAAVAVAVAAGVVMALRVVGRCGRGDALFQIGQDLA